MAGFRRFGSNANTRPPGASTRLASRSAGSKSGMWCRTLLKATTSKDPSAKGSRSASACIQAARGSFPTRERHGRERQVHADVGLRPVRVHLPRLARCRNRRREGAKEARPRHLGESGCDRAPTARRERVELAFLADEAIEVPGLDLRNGPRRPPVRGAPRRSPRESTARPRRASRERLVVASNPRTRCALLVSGTRLCHVVRVGGSLVETEGLRGGPSPWTFSQIASASSSTVVDGGVERLKSSLSAAG